MKPTRRSHPAKSAHMLALLAILALLFSGLAAPPAQAAPDAPQATTIIAALSDYGSGTTLEQTVADMIASWSPAWIVTAGDNYHYQSCSTYPTCVGNYYGSYVTAQTFKPTMGNHDLDATVGLTAYNTYFSYLPTSPDPQRRWYDFVAGDVHFFMLDGNGNQSTQSTWLSTAVPASTSTWNIAVLHQAPYSTGEYGDIAASQLPYGQYGIDFVISGHNHHFEQLVKADGGKTVRYFIDGYGGSLPTGLGHSECGTNTTSAASEFCLANTPGAIKITASDTSITFQYYDSSGAVQHAYTQDANEECTTVNLVATDDNYLSAANVQYNNGGSTELHVDATTGTARRTSLLKWDLSSIPSAATVSSASLSLYVSDASPLVFSLYNMRRAWVEGTSNRANSTNSSNWNTYDGTTSWGTVGAANVDSDRYDTNLWSAGTTSFSTTGSKTEALNAEGVGVVQGWIDGTVDNHGLIMQNYSESTSNAVFFASSENTTAANRPRLKVTYCVAAGPTITTSGTLTPFSTTPGTPSAAQTYTVSGSLLTESILITAPSGFEIKTDSGTYGPTITLPQTGGVVGATTISVRLTGAAEGNFAGNITHTSTGATQKDVAVSGYVGTAPICVTSRVSASADDVEERNDNGAVDLDGDTSTHSLQTFRAYAGGTTGTLNWWGLRFLNVNVPQGATIASADVTFRANLTSGTSASGMTLWGQLAANPGTFTTSTSNVTSRTRTSASATWNITQWTSGSDYATPDLSGVVQEIVDQPSWAANNALVVIGQTTVSQNRSAISRDSTNGATLAPLLEVCYTTAPPGPTITTSGALNPFSTTPGVPSAAQTYNVSGSNLTADIVIDAPAGFEIATVIGGPYASNLTLTQAGGTVAETTVYVRLTGAEGTFSDNIAHTSTGAVTRNVVVSGTASLCTTVSFQQGTAGYNGARDAYIGQDDPTFNYGATTPLTIDTDEPYNSSNDASALLYWDISTIPTGSTVDSADITVYVEDATNSATPGFDLYAMTQAWAEGTGNGSATANGATWNTYDGTTTWPGGAGGAGDKGSTALGNINAQTTSSFQFSLNGDGEAVLESWVNTPANNKGFMIHAGTEDNGLDFTSKEGTTVANRPKLTVTYCLAPTTPYITTSGTLNPFSSTINVPSAEQSYTVSGGNLTGNIVITAPAGFEVSKTPGSDFGPSVSLAPVSGTVAQTPIYVRFLSSTLEPRTGNITHESTGATARNVEVSGTIINGAPAVTLVQPADDATGIATPPTLQATVTDPEEETMSVSFYGRPVSTAAPAEDFTLFVIPDTQSHVASSTLYVAFNAMTNYIVAQKDTRNVAFVTHVGDIVNTSSNTTEWQRADAAMDILDTGSVSYSVGPGNHDVAYGTTYYPDWFGNARFLAQSTYQGYYTAEGDNYSNYSLFSVSGMNFILINLKYQPSTGALDWADGLLKTHSGRRGIVAQHDILNTNDTWVNQTTYNALSDNPNLFLIVCGHMHNSSDGSAYRLETRTDMNPVHVLLTDYQDYNNAANTGYLRILTFRPASDAIYAEVYSPYVNAYLTNASNYEQFTMAYDMEGTAAAPFELIGTVNGVASGANATITWTGRDPETEYEWYAVATDGTSSTTSTTWSFTTGTGTVAVPKAPVVTSIALSGSSDVDLTWDAVTEDVNDNSTTILEYRVYGSQEPYFTTGTLLPPSPTDPTFTHVGGSTGATNWYYLVRAFNAAGESANSPRRTGRFGFILVPGTAGN